MPTDDYLAGAVLFGAVLAAVVAGSAIVVRGRLDHLDALERWLAGTLIATAFLLAVHIVPLALGILSRGAVLVAAGIVLAAALAVPGPGRPGPPRASRPPRPSSGTAAWALAGIAVIATFAQAAAQLKEYAGKELVGVDPLTFHLPDVGRWIQSGSLWQIDQFLPGLAHGNYPNNGDVLLLWTVLPWHNDFLARFGMTFFLILGAVAVFAIARELSAPPAAAVLAGAAYASLPAVGLSTIPRAMPDAVLYAAFALAVLFLLRHAREGRRSDLVLAAIGAGIAFGTKWYGVSAAIVVVLVWGAGHVLATRRPWRVLGEGTVLAGGIALMGGIWLVRNLVESSNPVFPVRISPLGITFFDAPPDLLREQVGHSISDYFGDPDVLGELGLELIEGLGLVVIVGALAVLLALTLSARALRRGSALDARIPAVAIAAAGLACAYAVTPYTALGFKGDPALANVNTRYLVPAVLLAAPLTAWLAGALPRRAGLAVQAALAVSVVLGAESAYPVPTADAVKFGLAGAVALAGAWVLWRVISSPRRGLAVRGGAAGLAVLAALAFGQRAQNRINDDRYIGPDPAIDALVRAAPADKRIGLAGVWSVEGLSPIWPSFGTRIQNHVEYVGRFVDELFSAYSTRPSFVAALHRGEYDLLVVGRGLHPPQRIAAERWALGAGWRTLALSTRLRVLRPPVAG